MAGASPQSASEIASRQSGARVWLFQCGLLIAVLSWTLAWYWDAASSMADIWWRSPTFAHGMVVYPIALWMIWTRRDSLAEIPRQSSFMGLALVAVAGLAWLLGEVGGVQAARHLGFTGMIAAAVWSVFGTQLAKAITFPLVFTLLAVPFGEFLLPILIEHTADFTVAAVRLSGIPVYREGNSFVMPTGQWSVVEACSGLRYLIASITLGLVYAYLNYTSLLRRLVFVFASIAVPIVANWIRAYMIVMIGHLSGMKYAVGVDHILYGWVFFGIVMFLLFWGGSFWRQDVRDQPRSTAALAAEPQALKPGIVVGALLTAAVVAAPALYAEMIDSMDAEHGLFAAQLEPANGWKLAGEEAKLASGARRSHERNPLERSFTKNSNTVTVYMGYYRNERQVGEFISHSNAVFAPNHRQWKQVASGRTDVPGAGIEVNQRVLSQGHANMVVWHWYRVGGRWVSRPESAKALQALDKLRLAGGDAVVVAAYTRTPSGSAGDAQRVLQEFVTDMSQPLAATFDEPRAGTPRRAEAPSSGAAESAASN
jgi:exosortase A